MDARTEPTAGARPIEHDAIILAGGGGTRLGGVDKAALEVGGRPLLSRVLDGVRSARRTVVVGAVPVPDDILQTVEVPAGGGPVAGIAAGLRALADPPGWVLVLAVDQPQAAQAVPDLLAGAANADPGVDMVCPDDRSGHPQWLLAAYRSVSLSRVLAPLGTGHDVSVRRLVGGLRVVRLRSEYTGDVDTWADHSAWEDRLGERPGG
jgi:molybdopterin-guanine dinucleotide biosynthesis protein A